MQESFWWWQCSDRYIVSLSSHLHVPFPPPFSPSLISLMVSVDVKHHVYFLHPVLRPHLHFASIPSGYAVIFLSLFNILFCCCHLPLAVQQKPWWRTILVRDHPLFKDHVFRCSSVFSKTNFLVNLFISARNTSTTTKTRVTSICWFCTSALGLMLFQTCTGTINVLILIHFFLVTHLTRSSTKQHPTFERAVWCLR